jgi:hypothetical protein
MQKITFFLLCLTFFVYQCKEPAPLEIKPLHYPADAFKIRSMIAKNQYKSDGTFQPGYQSGKILSDRITLEWQEIPHANFLCYKIFRNDVEQTVISDQSVTTHIDSGLIHNTYYDYRLVHMIKNGMFSSDTFKIKTPQFARPHQFTYQFLSETSIKLFWSNRAESADQFDIYKRLISEPESAARHIATTSDTFYVDSDVIEDGQYFYHVVAGNDFESTEPSDLFYVFVNYIMNPPTLLSAEQSRFDRTVTLLWERNSTAEEGFRIYRKPQGGSYRMIAQVPLTAKTYTDRDTSQALRIDSTYTYALRAFNSREETGFSNEQTVVIQEPGPFPPFPDIFIRDETTLFKTN